jgi:hypothetical protein
MEDRAREEAAAAAAFDVGGEGSAGEFWGGPLAAKVGNDDC